MRRKAVACTPSQTARAPPPGTEMMCCSVPKQPPEKQLSGRDAIDLPCSRSLSLLSAALHPLTLSFLSAHIIAHGEQAAGLKVGRWGGGGHGQELRHYRWIYFSRWQPKGNGVQFITEREKWMTAADGGQFVERRTFFFSSLNPSLSIQFLSH